MNKYLILIIKLKIMFGDANFDHPGAQKGPIDNKRYY
jgi:hypothetical protein